ncbi:MAG: M23 family metallopeptidase [Puniceicoccales bacterium]|jgi:hypothetical protein|nr:M23 family metallopeptidase [Puniceicoccales bacterium]
MGKKAIVACLCLCCSRAFGDLLSLPTENCAVSDPLRYLQTAGTEKGNGGFGLARECGKKFHGGIDVRPVRRRPDGEPLDAVRAVADGVVVYANGDAGASSYGKYVVVEHENFSLPILSLYAHLASLSAVATVGRRLEVDDVLGSVGRTSSAFEIGKERAHLHFELALRLGDDGDFSRWYGNKKFSSPNGHGCWNGLNFVSFDPLPPLRMGCEFSVAEYVRNLPTAFVTRIFTEYFPNFLRRYGALLDGWDGGPIGGFDVEWTWFGLPKRWVALQGTVERRRRGNVEVFLMQNDWLWLPHSCIRETLARGRGNSVHIGKRTVDVLEKIFGAAVKILDSTAD